MRGQLTLGGAPILIASDGGGLILVLSVGTAASLSQQRNKSAQAALTEEKSTPEHHADVDRGRESRTVSKLEAVISISYSRSVRILNWQQRGPGRATKSEARIGPLQSHDSIAHWSSDAHLLLRRRSRRSEKAETTPTSGLPHKRISGGKKQALTAFFFRYTTSIRTDFRNRRGPGARLGRRISLEIVV